MSITAVPLRPIRKGSLTKLWLGLGALVLVGSGLAVAGTAQVRAELATNDQFLAANAREAGVQTSPTGLQFKVIKEGEGPLPGDGDVVLIGYKGTLRDGTVFDENPRAPLPVQAVVPGFSEALKKMKRGGSYRLWIPPELGYGSEDKVNPQTGEVALPGNSVLIFDVSLLEFRSQAELEAMQQQMMQQQGGAPGAIPPMPGQ